VLMGVLGSATVAFLVLSRVSGCVKHPLSSPRLLSALPPLAFSSTVRCASLRDRTGRRGPRAFRFYVTRATPPSVKPNRVSCSGQTKVTPPTPTGATVVTIAPNYVLEKPVVQQQAAEPVVDTSTAAQPTPPQPAAVQSTAAAAVEAVEAAVEPAVQEEWVYTREPSEEEAEYASKQWLDWTEYWENMSLRWARPLSPWESVRIALRTRMER
jgi:hypothetical protein